MKCGCPASFSTCTKCNLRPRPFLLYSQCPFGEGAGFVICIIWFLFAFFVPASNLLRPAAPHRRLAKNLRETIFHFQRPFAAGEWGLRRMEFGYETAPPAPSPTRHACFFYFFRGAALFFSCSGWGGLAPRLFQRRFSYNQPFSGMGCICGGGRNGPNRFPSFCAPAGREHARAPIGLGDLSAVLCRKRNAGGAPFETPTPAGQKVPIWAAYSPRILGY